MAPPSTSAERRQILERHRRPVKTPDLARFAGVGVDPRRTQRVRGLRRFLATVGGVAAGAGGGGGGSAGGGGGASPLTAPLGPPQTVPTRDPVLALVHRITPGFDLAEYERAKALGYNAYLEEQLDHLSINDSDVDARLASFTTLTMSPKQLADTYAEDQFTPMFELKGSYVVRAVHSKRHLYERMVEFWRDHFHIDHNKGDIEWLWLNEDDLTVIRPHALGSFPDMLAASAFSGGMQYYLDNWLNVAGAPQENYSRELMELHTLGVHGGYSEVDVKEVAKCFTGWTLNLDFNSSDYLRTTWDFNLHTLGPKLVLGQVIPGPPPSGQAQAVLDILSAHPSTADFISRKMIRWLLTPEPSEALVASVASTYLATNGDIKAMIRVILARENLAKVSSVLRPKFRRPFHYLTSILRTLQADVSDPLNPVILLFLAGHPPFEKVTPDGFPDTVEAWGSSLLPRWTMADWIVATGVGGVSINSAAVISKLGSIESPGLARRINERLLGRMLPKAEVDQLQAYINVRHGPIPATFLFETLTLAMSLPGFQWY